LWNSNFLFSLEINDNGTVNRKNTRDNYNTVLCIIDTMYNDQGFTRLHLLSEKSNFQLLNTAIILLY
jgi:hypothetical protein